MSVTLSLSDSFTGPAAPAYTYWYEGDNGGVDASGNGNTGTVASPDVGYGTPGGETDDWFYHNVLNGVSGVTAANVNVATVEVTGQLRSWSNGTGTGGTAVSNFFIRITDGAYEYVVYHQPDARNSGSGNLYVAYTNGGSPVDLKTSTSKYDEGDEFTIRAEVNSYDLAIYIDDVLEHTIDTFATSGSGLQDYINEGGAPVFEPAYAGSATVGTGRWDIRDIKGY